MPILPQAGGLAGPSLELLQSTVRAVRHFTLGNTAQAGTVSAATTALVKQAMHTMMVTKLKLAAAAALVIGMLACVATGLAAMGPARLGGRAATNNAATSSLSPTQSNGPSGKTGTPGQPELQHATIAFHGRVLGPQGKPVAGASIYTFAPKSEESMPAALRTKAASDGKFQFEIVKVELDAVTERGPLGGLTVVATAEGFGPDWVSVRKPPDGELSFRLVDDSVPITGRIVDLQGKPIAGARITRGLIKAEGAGGIDPYLTLVRDDPFKASNHGFAKYWPAMVIPGQPAFVLTDADGRFKLSGIGRDRIIDLNVEGPTIQHATIQAMTRAATRFHRVPVRSAE